MAQRPNPLPGTTNRVMPQAFVALATGFGFLFAFIYQAAFAAHFGIPLEFISLNWTAVLISGGALLAAAPFLFPFSMLDAPKEGKTIAEVWLAHPIRRQLFPATVVGVSGLLALWIYAPIWSRAIFSGSLAMGILVLELAWPVIFYRSEGATYKERLVAMQKMQAKSRPWLFIQLSRLGRWRNLVLVAVFGLTIAGQLGDARALKQKDFFVTNTEPQLVVLRIYGDKLVAAEWNQKTHHLLPGITILSLSGSQGIKLRLEHLGRLVPATRAQKPTL